MLLCISVTNIIGNNSVTHVSFKHTIVSSTSGSQIRLTRWRQIPSNALLTDDTFLELLKMLGLHKKAMLSYFDFMQKFEVLDAAEGHPWLNSQHR